MSKRRVFSLIVSVSIIIAAFVTSLWAQQSPELAAESEAYCASTASTKATPQMIMEKVNQGCTLLGTEGKAAFPRFMGKGSQFLFAGTYLWIHDLKGKMLMHPIKHTMVGNELMGLKDNTGKRFFVTMNQIAEEKGEGWVGYVWPKPGEKNLYPKVSFVKKCKMAGGEEVIVGCGAFDLQDELKKQGIEVR